MIFRAIFRRTGSSCSAIHTVPNAPSPIISRSRNRPIRSPRSSRKPILSSPLVSAPGGAFRTPRSNKHFGHPSSAVLAGSTPPHSGHNCISTISQRKRPLGLRSFPTALLPSTSDGLNQITQLLIHFVLATYSPGDLFTQERSVTLTQPMHRHFDRSFARPMLSPNFGISQSTAVAQQMRPHLFEQRVRLSLLPP